MRAGCSYRLRTDRGDADNGRSLSQREGDGTDIRSGTPCSLGLRRRARPNALGDARSGIRRLRQGNRAIADRHFKAGAGTANPWKLNYRSTALKIAHHDDVVEIVDNGHTIQVSVDAGSSITTSRNTYQLKQFHFHTPSEHTIDGKSFPMEVHFVHQSADNKFAVVAALFAEGPANENVAKLIANFPKAKGDSVRLPEVKLDLALQLPANTASYTYMGSFTTPPCTENVEWIVFRDPVMASREQLNAFAARLSPNNRPVQPLNGRTITVGPGSAGESR